MIIIFLHCRLRSIVSRHLTATVYRWASVLYEHCLLTLTTVYCKCLRSWLTLVYIVFMLRLLIQHCYLPLQFITWVYLLYKILVERSLYFNLNCRRHIKALTGAQFKWRMLFMSKHMRSVNGFARRWNIKKWDIKF